MWKTNVIAIGVIAIIVRIGYSQAPSPPVSNAEMAKKMETTCTGYCHGPSLIAQQRLDRNGWTREVEKMMRWGAGVAPADKEELINYLARTFNSNRPLPNTFKAVPPGKGSDLFQTYCLGCHDDRPITSRKLDKAAWTRVVEDMIKWGAYVPTSRKAELIDYLTTQWGR